MALPMIAPIAAKPVLPRNPRRLKLKLFPLFAAFRPVSRAMIFFPLLPVLVVFCRDSARTPELARVFALCGLAASPAQGAIRDQNAVSKRRRPRSGGRTERDRNRRANGRVPSMSS
ncbi:MAG TPA: hypothetical protein VGD13_02955, partial [Xanthobacteraceae bacterium]